MNSELKDQTPAKEKSVEGRIKPFSELCLMDNYMFDLATLDIETCKAIVEIALHIRIKEIRWKENQKSLPGPPGKRGVRLDFVVIDDQGNWYDVEMQYKNTGNLPKRTRFYRARQDSPLLNQGERKFDKLPPTYIIFICDFDLFGYGKYRYTFQNHCEEVPELILADEVHTVFLNTHGSNVEEVEPELVEFLRFVKDTTEDDANEYADSRVRKMYSKVRGLKKIAGMEGDYMASEWWIMDEKEESRLQGQMEEKQSTAMELYAMGMRENDIARAVRTDISIVRTWLASGRAYSTRE